MSILRKTNEDKKNWKKAARWWAASGTIEGYKRDHTEMRVFISGLLKGLIIGIITGALITFILIGAL